MVNVMLLIPFIAITDHSWAESQWNSAWTYDVISKSFASVQETHNNGDGTYTITINRSYVDDVITGSEIQSPPIWTFPLVLVFSQNVTIAGQDTIPVGPGEVVYVEVKHDKLSASQTFTCTSHEDETISREGVMRTNWGWRTYAAVED